MKRLVAVIPAAGKGTRVSPLPGSKELFPIGYQEKMGETGPYLHPKVIMQYLIDNLIAAGTEHFLIIISDNKWDIVRYYGNGEGLGISIGYLYQTSNSGMPGALDLSRAWLHEDDTVLFGMPDTIITPPDAFTRLLSYHMEKRSDITLGLFRTSTPERFGMVRRDQTGNLSDFVDKPTHTDLSYMWGIGCWGAAFTQLLSEGLSGRSDDSEPVLSEFFSFAVKRGLRVSGLDFPDGNYLDVGTPADLVSATHQFSQL